MPALQLPQHHQMRHQTQGLRPTPATPPMPKLRPLLPRGSHTMTSKVCVICAKAFTNKNPRCKTCSPQCSHEYQRQQSALWLSEHRDEVKSWHHDNDPKYAQQRADWLASHKELRREYNRKYYEKTHPKQKYVPIE
jgi:hypothetical protein